MAIGGQPCSIVLCVKYKTKLYSYCMTSVSASAIMFVTSFTAVTVRQSRTSSCPPRRLKTQQCSAVFCRKQQHLYCSCHPHKAREICRVLCQTWGSSPRGQRTTIPLERSVLPEVTSYTISLRKWQQHYTVTFTRCRCSLSIRYSLLLSVSVTNVRCSRTQNVLDIKTDVEQTRVKVEVKRIWANYLGLDLVLH